MQSPAPAQPDLATLAIAVVGLVVALFSLTLTLRRDRAAGRVGVRLTVESDTAAETSRRILIRLANPERRTVTVERVGLARSKSKGEPFPAWERDRPSRGSVYWAPRLPVKLEPGDPAQVIEAEMFQVRAPFFPDAPGWVWCEDSNGGVYWARIPKDVQSAVRATKRRTQGPVDDYGQPTSVEVEDDVVIAADLGAGLR
jgi:hypothetical protein